MVVADKHREWLTPGPLAWGLLYLATLVWSGVEPKDRFTWLLEVLPAMAGAVLLVLTRRRFPLTALVYVLILVHSVILMVGGHYTYAEVPVFDWLKEELGMARNNYDKVGHFAQGFVPAMIARELLIRFGVVSGHGWRRFLILCFCLALSAFYELIEWWVALLTGEGAQAFLGTQGDIWDTQADMAWALAGAVAALATLARLHDRQLRPFLKQ